MHKIEEFELTQQEGKRYIGSLFVSSDGPYKLLIIRLLDINEKGVCLWEQLPTFLIPSERDPTRALPSRELRSSNQSLEGVDIVCDFVVANHDEDPLPPKRMGKLLHWPPLFLPSVINTQQQQKVIFCLKKSIWSQTEPFTVHSVVAYGWTPGCRTQLGKNLGLDFVPKKRNIYGKNVFYDYFNFEGK